MFHKLKAKEMSQIMFFLVPNDKLMPCVVFFGLVEAGEAKDFQP